MHVRMYAILCISQGMYGNFVNILCLYAQMSGHDAKKSAWTVFQISFTTCESPGTTALSCCYLSLDTDIDG